MAFKQKSGSPFQRNFGVGKSPIKQNKTEEEIMAENASKLGENPMMMKSPAKAYMNMEKYSKPGDAVQFGEDKKDSPTDMGNHGKTPTYMKSGFKMKEGSPFQRNFGIGDSPVKDRGTAHFAEDKDWMGEEKYQKHAALHDDAYGPKHTEHGEQNPTKMKSPMKSLESYPVDFTEFTRVDDTHDGYSWSGKGSNKEMIDMYHKEMAKWKTPENRRKFLEMYPTAADYASAQYKSGDYQIGDVGPHVERRTTEDGTEIQIPYDQAMFRTHQALSDGVINKDNIAEYLMKSFTGDDYKAAVNELLKSGKISSDVKNEIRAEYKDRDIEEYADQPGSKEEQKRMFLESEGLLDASPEDQDKAFRKYLADISSKKFGQDFDFTITPEQKDVIKKRSEKKLNPKKVTKFWGRDHVKTQDIIE